MNDSRHGGGAPDAAELPEEVAEEVIDSAPCGFLSTLPDGTVFKVNQTFLDWIGQPRANLVGQKKFQDLLTIPGRIFYETHFVPLLRLQGFVNEISCHVARADGGSLPVLVNSRLKADAAGRPLVIRTTVFNATERMRYEQDLRAEKQRSDELAAIVQSSKDAMFRTSLDGLIQTWNPGAETLLGFSGADAIGTPVRELLFSQDKHDEFTLIYRKLSKGEFHSAETVRKRRDGTKIDVFASSSPIRNAQGTVIGVSEILRDNRAQKQHEEHVRRLMREVNHRAKNLLAVVMAVARQTRGSDPATFVDRFADRIAGLSASQDLLVRDEWKGVEIADLVRIQIDGFCDRIGDRLVLEGPPNRLTPAAAQAIGMSLHELATNAAKYGSLSNAVGKVNVAWKLTGPNRDTFAMSWTESGGPEVNSPRQTGFGHTVLVRMIKSALRGEAGVDYLKTGLVWNLQAPAATVLEATLDSSLFTPGPGRPT